MLKKKAKKPDKLAILVEIIKKEPLLRDTFVELAGQAAREHGFDFDICSVENWQTLGLDISEQGGYVMLNTANRTLNEQSFCVVDIETTGSISSGQIIEIGAIKIKNGKQTDSFSSLIYAPSVPEIITELTGIDANMLGSAPSLASVLYEFKGFLGADVFVAHNVAFDYNFISQSLLSIGLPPLLNRRLCTVELSRRIIPSQRYRLDALKELLGIQNTHHRAYSDAISAAGILDYCMARTPLHVHSAEDLIEFSKTAPSLQISQNC